MQGTNRPFAEFVKITVDRVVSSTTNWGQAWKHVFGRFGQNWSHFLVALATTLAPCHRGGSCLCFISLPLLSVLRAPSFRLRVALLAVRRVRLTFPLSLAGFVHLHSFEKAALSRVHSFHDRLSASRSLSRQLSILTRDL